MISSNQALTADRKKYAPAEERRSCRCCRSSDISSQPAVFPEEILYMIQLRSIPEHHMTRNKHDGQ